MYESRGHTKFSFVDEQYCFQDDWIKGLVREVGIGEIFEGEVKRILPFGAFVEILPGKEGLVHVSKMGRGFVRDPGQVVKIGQKVKVKDREIDSQGRINLQMIP